MPDIRDVIASKLLASGLSQHAFASLRGTSERGLQKHLYGDTISEAAARWYRRLDSVTVEGDHVVIRLVRQGERQRRRKPTKSEALKNAQAVVR